MVFLIYHDVHHKQNILTYEHFDVHQLSSYLNYNLSSIILLIPNDLKHVEDSNLKHLKNASVDYQKCVRNYFHKFHEFVLNFITNQMIILKLSISSIHLDFLRPDFLCKLINYRLMQCESFLFDN